MIGYEYVTLENVSSAINCNFNYCFHGETLYFAETIMSTEFCLIMYKFYAVL